MHFMMWESLSRVLQVYYISVYNCYSYVPTDTRRSEASDVRNVRTHTHTHTHTIALRAKARSNAMFVIEPTNDQLAVINDTEKRTISSSILF